MLTISDRNFESLIECTLLAGGPDACVGQFDVVTEQRTPYGTLTPGGYRKRTAADYDEDLCLDPGQVVAFIHACHLAQRMGQTAPPPFADFLRDVLYERYLREHEERA
jgi:hypothetical protein